MVDRAKEFHHYKEVDPKNKGTFKLEREFVTLFEKFRIGKIHFKLDSFSGDSLTEYKIVRCTDCHIKNSKGLLLSKDFLSKMRELTVSIARIKRMLLLAKRSGVEVGEAFKELSKAISVQIDLEVLVHTFSNDENSPFIKKHKEGMDYVTTAFKSGLTALKEVKKRRIWLISCLSVILMLMVALVFKIRSLQ